MVIGGREKKRQRDGREKKETKFFKLFDYVAYIILLLPTDEIFSHLILVYRSIRSLFSLVGSTFSFSFIFF